MKVLLTATVQSHICQFHKPLVEMLREQVAGIEIHVAANDNLTEKNGLKLDFVDRIFNLPFSRSPKSFSNLIAYKELKKIIETEKYDIIHCNTPMGGIITRLAAKKFRRAGVKVYYTAHGFHFYKGASKINWILYYPIEKIFSVITDKLITINQEDYDLAKNKFKCNVYHIHGVGVDSKRYYPVDDVGKNKLKNVMGYDPNNKYILCVGELLPNKNQQLIVKAMKYVIEDFPNTILLIAGNGPEKEAISEIVEQMDLKHNIEFLGYVTNLEQYQKISDISVSCSLREGLGLNLIEAMLTENPVIASKNRGHNELVINGQNGFLIDANDEMALADTIKLLITDKRLASIMGIRANEQGKLYEWEVVKRELENIYFV